MDFEALFPSISPFQCIIALGILLIVSSIFIVLFLLVSFIFIYFQAILEMSVSWAMDGPPEHEIDHSQVVAGSGSENDPIVTQNAEMAPSSLDELSQSAMQENITLLQIFLMEVLERLRDDREGEMQERMEYAMGLLPPPVMYNHNGTKPSRSTECVICLEDFVDEDTCRIFPVCKHTFHLVCIDSWLIYHDTCPICRGFVLDV